MLPVMIKLEVSSSTIDRIGYDVKNQLLYVSFLSGTIYKYSDVSRQRYSKLKSAESVGRYFNKYIKNSYDYKKL